VGKSLGPFVRVRVGDTVEVHLKNDDNSIMVHSVDFHAATGPGGGAEFTQADPGQEKIVTFKALVPGLFVYHCATPSVPHHITNGMYGLILVEPEGGMPQVDREFYVMQGELYTARPFGSQGDQEMDYLKLISERPEYFLFNGSVGALTKAHPLRARTGETVRVFFGVGGPNFTSSFHVIGEIFDRVYEGASWDRCRSWAYRPFRYPRAGQPWSSSRSTGPAGIRSSTMRSRGSREAWSAFL
jgi:nitrite reductase (NO-forming)